MDRKNCGLKFCLNNVPEEVEVHLNEKNFFPPRTEKSMMILMILRRDVEEIMLDKLNILK